MKLYTEEQVKIAYSKGNNDGYCGIQRDFEQLHLLPIELPSNEEIEDYSIDITSLTSGYAKTIAKSYYQAGAKWMKEQILNQNK